MGPSADLIQHRVNWLPAPIVGNRRLARAYIKPIQNRIAVRIQLRYAIRYQEATRRMGINAAKYITEILINVCARCSRMNYDSGRRREGNAIINFLQYISRGNIVTIPQAPAG